MSNSNGKITAPVSIESDIVPVLGETTYSLENLCRSSKINKWSYIKPIQDSNPVECSFTSQKYKDSLAAVYYYAPGVAPNTADYTYRMPASKFRTLDFNGYDHKSYAALCDVAGVLPANIDFDNCGYDIPITIDSGGLWQKLATPADSGILWDNALILVCTKGSSTRVFRTYKYGWQNNKVRLYLGDSLNVNQKAYDYFFPMDIASWNVSIFAVVIPRNHPDKTDEFIEITNSANNYQLYPLTIYAGKTYNPLKSGIKISNPKPRTRWAVRISEDSNYRNEYIPEDCKMTGNLMAIRPNGAGYDLWNEIGGITYSEWKSATGDNRGGTIAQGSILIGSEFVKMQGALEIFYYKFPGQSTATRPRITNYGANGVIAWGSNSVSITFNPLPMGTGTTYNEIFAAFYFVDPNTEP